MLCIQVFRTYIYLLLGEVVGMTIFRVGHMKEGNLLNVFTQRLVEWVVSFDSVYLIVCRLVRTSIHDSLFRVWQIGCL